MGPKLTSGFATTRPEPHLCTSQNPVCAGIVDRFALLAEGGWDAFSKTPTASNCVICFWVELHLGAKPTRPSRADNHAAKGFSSPCRGCCSRWDRWRNGNGKSDRNRRILLPSQRSESAGALVPATPGDLAHTNELRGIPLAARSRTHAFAPFKETSGYFGDPQKVWMLNFRVRDLDKMAAQLQAAGIEVKIDPQSYPNGRFARVHDPEGNPIELWQPAKPDAPH
jgi:catechol 2,3-dioxygenase-like lactoylglutathione lyase family enzyme